jgi:hypothetical protein
MTLATIRNLAVWHLLFIALAIVAFWAYYQTLDPHNASLMLTNTADAQNEAVTGWVEAKRQLLQHHWHAWTGWRNDVQTTLVTPH